jgi:hypothetical protein
MKSLGRGLEMTTSSPQLHYAPQDKIFTGRRTRRIIVLAILLTVALTAFLQRQRIAYYYGQAKALRVQRDFLNFTAPPDRICFAEGDEVIADLLARPDYASAKSFETVALWWPPLIAPRQVSLLFPYNQPSSGGLVFSHERVTLSGKRRLLLVWIIPAGASPIPGAVSFSLEDFEPATWHTPLRLVSRAPIEIPHIKSRRLEGKHLRVHAGQPDPADPSHFTIRYELDGVDYFLDGYERDEIVDVGVRESGLRLQPRQATTTASLK